MSKGLVSMRHGNSGSVTDRVCTSLPLLTNKVFLESTVFEDLVGS